MLKLKISLIIFCVITSFSFSSYAANDFKDIIRKTMIEECIKGYEEEAVSEDIQISMFFGMKFCKCTVDKVIKNYSISELIEINNYGKKYDEFLDDMENSANECLFQLLDSET